MKHKAVTNAVAACSYSAFLIGHQDDVHRAQLRSAVSAYHVA